MYLKLMNSVWNPYTFPGAVRIVSLLIAILVGVFLSALAAVMIIGKREERKLVLARWKLGKILCMELLLFWLFTIFSATLLGRNESSDSRANLELFWTLRYAWMHHSGRHWYYIIGNIALFIPLGFLLPVTIPFLRHCFLTVFTGFFLSVAIESVQYYWSIGLFELDDIMHNTWGTLLGFCLYFLLISFIKRKKRNISDFLCTLSLIAGTILAFLVLLTTNKPDWKGIF